MIDFHTYGLLALVGAGGGLIAGIAGLAGGIVIVPALVVIYGTRGMGDAIVVSFFAVLFNSLSATIENRKARGAKQFEDLVKIANFYTLGAIATAFFVAVLFGQHKGAISKPFLASLQLLLAACMLIPRACYEKARMKHGKLKDTIVGSIVGGVSTLIGVGGGTYTIFYFLTRGRDIKDCTLIANFVGIFIGAMSIAGYYGCVAFASPNHIATSHSIIDAVGKAILIIFGIAACPLGVKLQKRLPAGMIKKTIVLTLAASSCYVLFVA
jgi:uncharacterized protein